MNLSEGRVSWVSNSTGMRAGRRVIATRQWMHGGRRWFSIPLSALVMLLMTSLAHANVYKFSDPEKEAQYNQLIQELRCPKCQNQNVADSNAPIAQDIKSRVHEWIEAGWSSEQIVVEMVERYTDFVTYRPPMNARTYFLWFTPPLIFIIALVVIIFRVSKRSAAVSAVTVDSKRVEDLLDEIDSK